MQALQYSTQKMQYEEGKNVIDNKVKIDGCDQVCSRFSLSDLILIFPLLASC